MVDICFALFVIIAFLLICIWGGSHLCIGEEVLQQLNNLRGIFALEIVIGHVIQRENMILYPFKKFMIIAVAYFFFVSAFGLTVSYQKKKNYLKVFYLKPLYLFALAAVIYAYNMVICAIFPEVEMYFAVTQPFGRNFLGYTNWYIWELLIFYMLFWIINVVCKKYSVLIITLITVLATTIIFILGAYECWYASAFAFPMGMMVGKYYERFSDFINSKSGWLVTVVLTVLGLCSLVLPDNSVIGMVYLRNCIDIAVILLLIYICSNYKLGNNMIGRILGKYSTEIYISQFVYLAISDAYEWDYKIRLIFVLGLTLFTSWILHPIVAKIRISIKNAKIFCKTE